MDAKQIMNTPPASAATVYVADSLHTDLSTLVLSKENERITPQLLDDLHEGLTEILVAAKESLPFVCYAQIEVDRHTPFIIHVRYIRKDDEQEINIRPVSEQ